MNNLLKLGGMSFTVTLMSLDFTLVNAVISITVFCLCAFGDSKLFFEEIPEEDAVLSESDYK